LKKGSSNPAARRSLLVCLVGMDGVGKTTHAKQLCHRFRQMGVDSRYVYGNRYFFWGLLVSLFAKLLGYKKESSYQWNRALSYVWSVTVLLDYLPVLLGKILFPKFVGATVVCDRYVYDIFVYFRYNRFYFDGVVNVLKLLSPIPNIVFLLDAPEEVVSARKPENDDSYYMEQRRIYHELADRLHFTRVDAERPFWEVQSDLDRLIDLMMSRTAERDTKYLNI